MTRFSITLLFLIFCWAATALPQSAFSEVNQVDNEGKKQGRWIIKAHMLDILGFQPDDVVEEGDYLNDMREGTWQRYYPSGETRSEILYRENIPNGPYKIFYEDGQIEESGNWRLNKNTGDYLRFYENGQLQQKFTFNKTGKRNGRQFYYHENGQLAMEVEVANGKENGDLVRYDENGLKTEESSFENGVMKSGSLKRYGNTKPKQIKVDVPKDAVATEPDASRKANAAHSFQENGFNTLYDQNYHVSQIGLFKRGRLWDGKWMRYSKDGILIRIDLYKAGRFIGHGQIEK